MGCCGNNKNNVNLPKPMFDGQDVPRKVEPKTRQSVMRSMYEAAISQPNKITWIRDGITGLIKCALGKQDYSDTDIQKNRDVCRDCEFATKNDKGELTNKSQCMAPDPTKNNAPCGCIIMCKTQVGECPKKKWTHLTINGSNNSSEEISI